MNANIKSISLSYDQVAAILEEWINANLLRVPHRVTDIDPCDYDAHNTMQFNIALEPAPIAPIGSIAASAPESRPLQIGTSGNGNGRSINDVALDLGRNGPIAATQETAAPVPPTAPPPAPVAATAGRKSRTERIDDQTRAEIIRLREAGVSALTIARELGVGESSVYHIVATTQTSHEEPHA